MNLFITKQPTNGYSTIADGDEETDNTSVPRSVRSWSGVVAVVALLLLVAGGGAVWMLPDAGSSYTTATGSLVVATIDDTRCLPATGAFGGVSTLGNWLGERAPFETCYYQIGSDATFCWTKAWQYLKDDDDVRDPYSGGDYYNCVPNDGVGSTWRYIDTKDINPVDNPNPNTNTCGPPCQGQKVDADHEHHVFH